jgi:hypothetical protein
VRRDESAEVDLEFRILKIQNPKSKIQNPKSKIRNQKSEIQN